MCSKSFLSRPGNELYKYITETVFGWTINTGNYSIVKQSNGCKFMPKMHQKSLAAWFRPDPLGELMHSPRPISRIGGPTSKGDGREEREERGDGKGGQVNSTEVKVSRINAVMRC